MIGNLRLQSELVRLHHITVMYFLISNRSSTLQFVVREIKQLISLAQAEYFAAPIWRMSGESLCKRCFTVDTSVERVNRA